MHIEDAQEPLPTDSVIDTSTQPLTFYIGAYNSHQEAIRGHHDVRSHKVGFQPCGSLARPQPSCPVVRTQATADDRTTAYVRW